MWDTGSDNPQAALHSRRQALRWQKAVKKFVGSLLGTILVILTVFGVLGGIGIVQGGSMLPALSDGTLILIWRMNAHYHYGDVVLFQRPEEDHKAVKRIVGLPGDTVDIREGKLWVNYQVVKEPYLLETTEKKETGAAFPVVLGKEEYFVLGDHRRVSRDSRNYGPIHQRDIAGKMVLFFTIGTKGLAKK